MRERDVYAIECGCGKHFELPAGIIDALGLPTMCPTCGSLMVVEWKAARDADAARPPGHVAHLETAAETGAATEIAA